MADPYPPSAAIAAGMLSSGGVSRAPAFYGGGQAQPAADSDFFVSFLRDYIAHHPIESGRLTEQLRTLLHPVRSADPFHYAPLYLQTYSSEQAPSMAPPSRVQTTHTCDFVILDSFRSDVASLARFSQHVDHATFYLVVAIDADQYGSAWKKTGVTKRRSPKSLYEAIARETFSRWKTTRNLLAHNPPIAEKAESLYRTAFWSLCELTPADSQLKQLFDKDRLRACRELVRHVDAVAESLALAAELADSLAEPEDTATSDDPQARTAAIQSALLAKAGDQLTLTQAAERLGITRQALHKKIKTGGALGLMLGDTFVVPAIQLVETKSRVGVVAHLREVLTVFLQSGAGGWSALQYLIEPDPALAGVVPIEALKEGGYQRVIAAARAYLGLDEG